MPNFYCEKCGSVNLVPPEASQFTCKMCGAEQPVPAHSESVEDTSLNEMVLKPEEEKEVDTSSLFNRFASFENVRVYRENEADAPARDEATVKEGIYYTALSKMGGEDLHLYQEALEMLLSLKGYKDADVLAGECRQKIAQLEAAEAEKTHAEQTRKKKRKVLLAITIPAVVILIAAVLLTIFVFVPQSRYNKALAAA